MTKEAIENLFSYHVPDEDQAFAYGIIRDAAKRFAYAIEETCPESPDRTAAIRKAREAMMIANASIATNGGFYR